MKHLGKLTNFGLWVGKSQSESSQGENEQQVECKVQQVKAKAKVIPFVV